MNRPDRRRGLCAALALLMAGCAVTAVRPPTPAARLNLDPNEPPPPGEHYYVLVFASQRVPRTPPYSHTFATVVHTAEQGQGQQMLLDAHTISWLPATLVIRTLRPYPEPGVNLSLKESLDYAWNLGERVSLWGPYECKPNFVKRFLVQKEFIETSGIGYQCCDNCGEAARTGDGCDCIHAITDSDPEFGRDNYPLIWFGDPASEHVAYRLLDMGTLIKPEVEHDWLLGPLGLAERPIRRRHFGDRLLDFPRVQPARDLFGWLRPAVSPR